MSTLSHFPKDFLWGSATSSFQVEGGIENNDWAEAARQGQVPPCGKACDHYARYEKDFDYAAQLNHTSHRFSIEWSRIQPSEGEFDEQEIEHYRSVLRALHERGITPLVTCWHWTLPLWLAEKGGMSNEAFPEYFSQYCKKLVEELGDEALLWITMNEPMVVASHGYMKGSFPPFRHSLVTYVKVIDILIQAHLSAYRRMKEVRDDIQVGIAKHNIDFASNWNPFNIVRKIAADWWWNERFLDAVCTHQDFIGLNHYLYVPYGLPEEDIKTDMGWNIHPSSLYRALMRLREYNTPVFVTENGLADADDSRREHYIREYTKAMKRAIEDGISVRGYFYWSLLDNYEWTYGFSKRFGLLSVNFDTLERTIRDSARAYARLIKEYTPEEE